MKQKIKSIFTICSIAFVCTQAVSQTPDTSKVNALDLAKYEISCYCETTTSTPDNIIKLDNNGQILLECISGKTIEQLKANGIQFTESQIRLLQDWRLLQENEDILKTTFPILSGDKIKRLRGLMKEKTLLLGKNLSGDVTDLSKKLQSIGREKNTYTIFFSYILDDLVWDRFAEEDILKEQKVTIEKPFWNGVLWAFHPHRIFSCGTNSITDKGVSLKVNWSEVAIKKMMPFVADWNSLSKLFDDLVERGKIENQEVKKVFNSFNLFDSSGRFTIPIIEETKDNAIYQSSLLLSKKVSNNVLKLINLKELKNEFGFSDEEQTLVIIYHELMWELLDYFEAQNIIRKPIAFANPEQAQSKDIGDLIFIVKEKKVKN